MAVITAIVVLALPAASRAAVDFGENLVDPPDNGLPCPDCTVWNTLMHPSYYAGTPTSPVDGILVSFTIRKAPPIAGDANSPMHVRVIRPSGSQWSGLGASSPEVVPSTAAGLETFPARLPIRTGDYLGVEANGSFGDLRIVETNPFIGQIAINSPPLPADGTPVNQGGGGSLKVSLRGRVEADADGDGFGDETQDGCPVSAKAQEPCICRNRPATIAGGPGKDKLKGTGRADIIAGLGGKDTIRGGRGKDVICGGAGRDRLIGGGGKDKLVGGPGRDIQVP